MVKRIINKKPVRPIIIILKLTIKSDNHIIVVDYSNLNYFKIVIVKTVVVVIIIIVITGVITGVIINFTAVMNFKFFMAKITL